MGRGGEQNVMGQQALGRGGEQNVMDAGSDMIRIIPTKTAGVRRGCRRVVVPPRFVTVPCLCVALGGVACLGRRRLARVSHRGCTSAVTVVARPP